MSETEVAVRIELIVLERKSYSVRDLPNSLFWNSQLARLDK